MSSAQEITLIVAATNLMGIGKGGVLPWTGLKKEMAYFTRVTKRSTVAQQNAVIMGRKTWDSIPTRFRPLVDRLNVVVTRGNSDSIIEEGEEKERKNLFVVNSLDSALKVTTGSEKTFVIGGAQIYQAALEMQETKRILLTRILNDVDCDTKFPLQLNSNGTVTSEQGEGSNRWKKNSQHELSEWIGETCPEAVQEENGIQYVFEMWHR